MCSYEWQIISSSHWGSENDFSGLLHLLSVYVDDLESRRDVPWGELVEEAESRTPGRVVHVHEKLSSPCRKRWLTELFVDMTDATADRSKMVYLVCNVCSVFLAFNDFKIA